MNKNSELEKFAQKVSEKNVKTFNSEQKQAKMSKTAFKLNKNSTAAKNFFHDNYSLKQISKQKLRNCFQILKDIQYYFVKFSAIFFVSPI